MACVAGLIAGSSLPLQAQERTGVMRTVHERWILASRRGEWDQLLD